MFISQAAKSGSDVVWVLCRSPCCPHAGQTSHWHANLKNSPKKLTETDPPGPDRNTFSSQKRLPNTILKDLEVISRFMKLSAVLNRTTKYSGCLFIFAQIIKCGWEENCLHSGDSSTCPRGPSPAQGPDTPGGRLSDRCHTGWFLRPAGRPRSSPGGLSRSRRRPPLEEMKT